MRKYIDTHNWEEWELGMVRMFYDGSRLSVYKLANFLGVPYLAIKGRIKAEGLRLPKKEDKWEEWELQYLRDNWGVLPDEEVCQHLGRSLSALHIASVRKLKMCRHDNIITARQLAPMLGVLDSKTIITWVDRNWLGAERSDIHCGKTLMWRFTRENIELFVKAYPWLFQRSRMQDEGLREIVAKEYTRDPWYSLSTACSMVGISVNSAAMSSYLRKKWLHPIKKAIEGGNHWTWIFFKSDIDKFLADDPRAEDIPSHIKSRQLHRLQEGRPIQLYMLWKMKCPVCRKMVRIEANPHINIPNIQKLFQETFCPEGKCRHKSRCRLETPVKPYKIRRKWAVPKTYPGGWPKRKRKNQEVLAISN